MVSGFEFQFPGLGFRVSCLGFHVSGFDFGFRVSGLGFLVSGFWLLARVHGFGKEGAHQQARSGKEEIK